MTNEEMWREHEAKIKLLQGKWKLNKGNLIFEIIGTGILNIEGLECKPHQQIHKTYFTLEYFDGFKITNECFFDVIKGDLLVSEDTFTIEGFPAITNSNGKKIKTQFDRVWGER